MMADFSVSIYFLWDQHYCRDGTVVDIRPPMPLISSEHCNFKVIASHELRR